MEIALRLRRHRNTDLREMVAEVRAVVVGKKTESDRLGGLNDARDVSLLLRDVPDDVRQVAVVGVPQRDYFIP